MLGYEPVPGGRSPFVGDGGDIYRFTHWRRVDDPTPLVYVYVQSLRIKQEPRLEWARSEGSPCAGGFAVPLFKWTTWIGSDGVEHKQTLPKSN
jgi:hypothetical protein